MGIDSLTLTDVGTVLIPKGDGDWNDWVSATQTRNHVLGDPILDWLDIYGDARGYERDSNLPGYDIRTDFTEFIFEQGRRFESAVVDMLSTTYDVLRIADNPEDSRSLSKAQETFAAMAGGVSVIHQGVLIDPQHKTYGLPDLLVRSDVLNEMFPGDLSAEEAIQPARDLHGSKWHYRTVDIKFTTLTLLAGGELGNTGSAPAYKVQVFIYNRALGRLQGYEPPVSYLIGRSWSQGKDRGSGCMERLGPVPQNGSLTKKRPISQAVEESVEWMRRLRSEGDSWVVTPKPSLEELYPNDGNNQDGPWHHTKDRIANELEDLTQLWQVGVSGRDKGHDAGIYRWSDSRIVPEIVGVTGEKQSRVLSAILRVNTDVSSSPVQPDAIQAESHILRETPPLEFYVDFETVNDLADDLSQMPQKGGQPLIFMIGCGHIEDGEWSWTCFSAHDLSEACEAEIIDAWFSHMVSVKLRIHPQGEDPYVFHWSHAERSNFETAFNSAQERHSGNRWPNPKWFDLLNNVIRDEPVVVRGSLNFGLKSMAKALHSHDLIETLWKEGPSDGLGAMVGAWWCSEKAAEQGCDLDEMDLMQEIAQYNQVDCKVMWEILSYLRLEH